MPALVHDPGDPGREWKLFWHRYIARLPYRDAEDRMFVFGWIAMRHAPSPEGPWSEEIPLMGAGPFPLPPYRTELRIGDFHTALANDIILTEPGVLAREGQLYLSLQAVRTPQLGENLHDIILLASDDHGASWRHVGIVLTAEEAKEFGATWFTGSSITEQDGRIFLLVTPEIAGEPQAGHRGTFVLEFADLSAGTLRRGPDGHPVVIRRLKPTLSIGGQGDYDAGNSAGGIVVPQFDMRNLPRAFRIFSTGVPIVGG